MAPLPGVDSEGELGGLAVVLAVNSLGIERAGLESDELSGG